MAHDVFISYPSQNRAIADAIRTALEASDIRCWIAPRDIPAGVPYATAVIRALNESRLVVLVYSAHANASVHVLSEVDRAHSKGVAIIPVRVQDAPMSEELEYRLSTTQWFDALTRPFEKHLRGLADAVGLRLDSTERSPAGSVHVVAPTMSRRQGAETAVERPERRRASLAGRPVVSSPKDSIRAPLAPVTEAEVSPRHPTAFLFVVDQSESMLRSMSDGVSKAQHVTDALNQVLADLVARCARASGTTDYCEVGVLGYGEADVRNMLSLQLANSIIQPISAVAAHPLRGEERVKKHDDAGVVAELAEGSPIWVVPHADGAPCVSQAIKSAAQAMAEWCDDHRGSFPPTVTLLTAGPSTDEDPEQLGRRLRQIATKHGGVRLLTLLIGSDGESATRYPIRERGLVDDYSRKLLRMSSPLPQSALSCAARQGNDAETGSKGCIINAGPADIGEFLEVATHVCDWS